MKYLKLFVEGFKSDYYQKITSDEFQGDDRWIPFEKRYYTKLIEMGFDYASDTKYGISQFDWPCSGYFNGLNIYIYQREDDYFDVEIYWYDKGVYGNREYYRCDQFDGLLELLKDKKVILK